jgi:hypothetical protein
MNTSVGNVLLMCMMLYSWLERRRALDQVTVVNNGDDFVLICEARTWSRLQRGDTLPDYCLRCGFTVVMEPPAFELEQVEFCQSKPVFDGEDWTMVRNPHVVIDKDTTCLASVQQPKELLMLMKAVGDCGTSLAGGYPVLGEHYRRLQAAHTVGRADYTLRTSGMAMLAKGMSRVHTEPSHEARASFFAAYGITPAEQLEIESALKNRPVQIVEDSVLTRGPVGLHL